MSPIKRIPSMITLKEAGVPVLQDEWEFSMLYNIYFDLVPRNVIEIGTFYGGTMYFWLRDFFLDTLVIIDMPIPKIDPRYKEMEKSKEKWVNWIDDVEEFVPIYADSKDKQTIDKVHKVFSGEKKSDMLFIDGGHDYKTVKSDYENYSDIVKKDGIIVFHDITFEPGVRKFWQEVKREKVTVEINKKYGIGVIFV